jgi:hypothetical protein
MRLKNWLMIMVLPLLAFLYASCTKTNPAVCTIETDAVTTVSNAMSSALECNAAGAAVIQDDVTNVANGLNLCTSNPAVQGKQKPDPVICGVLVSGVVGTLKTFVVPSGCAATVASNAVTTALNAACSAIPGP